MTIYYNALNLPRRISFDSGGSLYITYDAGGVKLKKQALYPAADRPINNLPIASGTYTAVTGITSTGRVDAGSNVTFKAATSVLLSPGFEVKQGGVFLGKVETSTTANYTQDYLQGIEYLNASLQAIYNTEGRLYYGSGTSRYEYTLADHLGNARICFTDQNADGIPEIIQENHYYPFGLAMEGSWANDPADDNKYQYNGIERNEDFGCNLDMAFFRSFDAAIGRWIQIDPKSNYALNSYCGMANNPISFSDPIGDTTYIFSERGRYINTIYGEGRAEYHFVKWKDRDQYKGNNLNEAEVRGKSSYFIGQETLSQLKSFASKSEKLNQEIGGLLYIGKNREIQLKECDGCSHEKEAIRGMDVLSNYSDIEGVEFIGSWHTHPINTGENAFRPSNRFDNPYGDEGDVEAFDNVNSSHGRANYRLSGGLGLISNVKGLVFYQHDGTIYNIARPSSRVIHSSSYYKGTDGYYFSNGNRVSISDYYNPATRYYETKKVMFTELCQ